MVSHAAGLQYRPDEEKFFCQVDTASGCVPSSEQYCMPAITASMGWGGKPRSSALLYTDYSADMIDVD